MNALTAAALATNQDQLALGNEVVRFEHARFIRNLATPEVHNANVVDSVTASSPAEIDSVLAAAEQLYAYCGHLRFDLDARTPPEFEARLALDSAFSTTELLVSVLEDAPRGRPAPFDIRPVVDDAGWAVLSALQLRGWLRDGEEGRAIGTAVAASMRRKSPPMRYWLGYIDGAPAGYFGAWEGTHGVGQVENLFVHPDRRHRGLATALLVHCVADCRAQGAGPVVIVTAVSDTPKQMYAALGWRPVAVKRSYLKPSVAEGAPNRSDAPGL